MEAKNNAKLNIDKSLDKLDLQIIQAMMQDAGFAEVSYHNLTGGIVALHRGYKF